MNSDFQLRSGKHKGKTIEWLEENEPSYLAWVKENRPEMLKEIKIIHKPKKEVIVQDMPTKGLTPNLNFYNEGPDPISLPYLNKMKQDNNITSFFDLDF